MIISEIFASNDILSKIVTGNLDEIGNGCGITGKIWKTASGHWVPDVDRVHFNKNKTIVFFKDGTRTVVTLSDSDPYDRKTAIVYAIVKRMFGKVEDDNSVSGNGFGTKLQKIVDAGFDQVKAKEELAEKKKAARAEHEARQEAAKKAAFERKVKARAQELAIERAAEKLLSTKSDSDIIGSCKNCTCKKTTILNETPTQEDVYVRPDKPFSQFTQEEKQAYWRNQYKNRKNK
jgi:hypothetical protein